VVRLRLVRNRERSQIRFEPASIRWMPANDRRRECQTVAATLVDTLEQIGVRQIFGLIADSLNALADAVRHSKIEWIGIRHEEGAALAAAGQAKLTGQLGVCCGTTGPGGAHLVAGL
jgi:pyruvate dehydrogenase (quinone)